MSAHSSETPGRWVTQQEAAQELGISTEAVRMRVRRGSLESRKEDSGRVVAWVVTTRSEDRTESAQQPGGLVEELRRHNEYLQGQVEAEREARLRADHIIARLSESNAELSRTVRELEGAEETPPQQEAYEDSESGATQSAETSTGDEDQGEPQQGAGRRSIWRRLLGR